MNKIFVLIIISTIMPFTCSDKNQSVNNTFVRNNEDEVYFKVSMSSTKDEYKNTLEKVRDFIWLHWNSHRVGKLKLESYTKEGEKILTIFEIKFNENNKQIVEVNIEGNYVDRNPNSKSYRQIFKTNNSYIAEDIVRIEMPKGNVKKRQILSKNNNDSPKLYLLRLKDEKGKVLAEI